MARTGLTLLKGDDKLLAVCRLLGSPKRLAIVRLLSFKGMRAVDLAESTGWSYQSIYNELHTLRHAGFLRSERDGRGSGSDPIVYHLASEAIRSATNELIGIIESSERMVAAPGGERTADPRGPASNASDGGGHPAIEQRESAYRSDQRDAEGEAVGRAVAGR